MKLKHLHIPGRGDYAPRLFRRDCDSQEGRDTRGRIDLQDEADLSYEDALAAAQLRRYLHSEFGNATPPPGSFSQVLRSVEADMEPGELRKRARAVPVPAPSLRTRLYESLSRLAAGPVMGRMASGFVALLIAASILASNSSMLRGGDSHAVRVNSTPETSQVSGRAESSASIAPYQAPTQEPVVVQYNRSAMLQADPPETQAPPRQALGYFGFQTQPNTDTDGGRYGETLSKE